MRKEHGLCVSCGRPLDRIGAQCTTCRNRINAFKRLNTEFYRKNHLCTSCGKERVYGDERQCPECREKKNSGRKPLTEQQKVIYYAKNRENNKRIYAERKEKGICTKCGKLKPVKNRVKCGICLEKERIARRKQYDKKDKAERGFCYVCGGELMEGNKLCKSCYEKSLKSLEIARKARKEG